ncbi:MAG: PqqD family peptide modification chaperone [Nocardioides sp.]|uniref:PqqD family peptide modification chaperone n=1 Tax=Nocardioides sp. TaxID=35761 RepID=UPI0039E58759
MTTRVLVEALGVVVAVDVTEAEVATRFRAAWVASLAEDGAEPDVVIDDSDLPGREADALLELLTQRVTIEAIGVRAGELLMFHACALANPDTGAAVVMVGPSGMGKSTLSMTHGTRWAYVTDETAAIEDDGTLLPYPKPLSMVGSGTVKEQVAPEAAGLTVACAPLRVAAVLLLERDPGVTAVQVTEVPPAQGIALVAEHTSYLAKMDRPLAQIAALLRSTDGLRRVSYAEARDLAPLLEELLTQPLAEPSLVEPVETSPGSTSSLGEAEPTAEDQRDDGDRLISAIRRTVLDEHTEDGEAVVLLPDGHVLALSPLASTVLAALADGPQTVPSIAAILAAEFGAPPDGDTEAATLAALTSLAQADLIRLDPPG